MHCPHAIAGHRPSDWFVDDAQSGDELLKQAQYTSIACGSLMDRDWGVLEILTRGRSFAAAPADRVTQKYSLKANWS